RGRIADSRLGINRNRLPGSRRPKREYLHSQGGHGQRRWASISATARVSKKRGRQVLQELRSQREHGTAALDPSLRRGTSKVPGKLHRQLAEHARECDLRLRRTFKQGIDASRSA